ncbi:penicillin-binding protein activator [Thermomonas sp.]|uniref:penicillin-binding protein activator n=1 Tax=Thermomonas sp. TaxID=1971895 RepID=UPI002489A4B8|nr:penicillin-binding protein activator [Thermomonas sp.]MDI1254268.1 penicillin-binding protein activator [Thermomonas sp.]
MALKHLAIALLLAIMAAVAGCASVEVQHIAPVVAHNPVFAEARTLASQQASLPAAARAANAARIETLLAQLDDASLSRGASDLPTGDPLYNFAGRALLNRGLPLPRAFDRGDWQFDAANRPPADRDGYRPPVKVALLLPLSGNLAAAAEPVRDGFLTGYYGERRHRPELRFYDTTAGASLAYARAVAEGNDFVVGPLSREEVDAVFANAAPPVPLLALNRGSRMPPPGSASFSLSPEDEGITAAEYILDSGARRVLIISGNDDAQRRASGALAEHLLQRGGQVAARLDYRPGATLVLPADSNIDAVFLALKGSQAHELAPRLAAAGLAGKPRVATSQIVSGTGKASEDLLLDGIVYPTETWGVRDVPGIPSQASAAARTNSARGPAARLFAFGYDAWLLTAYLERLALSPNSDIAGATGRLSLDGFGNVLRRPSWSRFTGGVAVPVADDAH